jgi:prepilin-type N-terminal cleavage/methylation domain-containing protein
MIMPRFQVRNRHGFTMAELLMTLSIGALVIGAAAVSFGTFTRAQPRAGNTVTVQLDSARMAAYYGLAQPTVEASVAPNYGSMARAELLRERFIEDTLSGTAVYCLSRNRANTYHPHQIPYDPAVDTTILDRSTAFFGHLVLKSATTGVSSTSFQITSRNHSPLPVPATSTGTTADTYTYGASIFVIGYSADPAALAVTAVYDIDIDKVASPPGFYASVKRWASSSTTGPRLTDFYDVYYPPSAPATWPATTDQFAPLWTSFERSTLLARTESSAIDRFKRAKEQPFHLIWWPDPAARTLEVGRARATYPVSDPRETYAHMLGRTAFMFTVPMFPASSS